ncbi:hypothetical protein NC651_012307 [Populus alba x Populus x berolinensis]|nr:hypothetical protein NC651_012307 [Populus alba x Populus x berolinensis]
MSTKTNAEEFQRGKKSGDRWRDQSSLLLYSFQKKSYGCFNGGRPLAYHPLPTRRPLYKPREPEEWGLVGELRREGLNHRNERKKRTGGITGEKEKRQRGEEKRAEPKEKQKLKPRLEKPQKLGGPGGKRSQMKKPERKSRIIKRTQDQNCHHLQFFQKPATAILQHNCTSTANAIVSSSSSSSQQPRQEPLRGKEHRRRVTEPEQKQSNEPEKAWVQPIPGSRILSIVVFVQSRGVRKQGPKFFFLPKHNSKGKKENREGKKPFRACRQRKIQRTVELHRETKDKSHRTIVFIAVLRCTATNVYQRQSWNYSSSNIHWRQSPEYYR